MAKIEIPYKPRELQQEIHDNLRRFSVLVCHRRFGKTVLCINELIKMAVQNQRREPIPRYAYVAPFRNQAKDIAWDYLKHYTRVFPGMEISESDLWVKLPTGARIRLYGADNPDAMRGPYLDGAVLDEYGQIPPALWGEVIRPQLVDYEGWAIFIGTPKGKNAFYRRYRKATTNPNWFTAIYRASETGVVAAAELEDARVDMTDDEYEQEFECSWEAPLRGAYYGADMTAALKDGRIRRVPHQRGAKVETWWDLGHSDATAIWFIQRVATEIHCIDYYENRLKELDHYAMILQSRAMNEGYVYGDHIWPHDGANKTLASKGLRLSEMMAELNVEVRVQSRFDVQAGIQEVRKLLPRCWFDETRCERGIEALKSYRSEEDDSRSDGDTIYLKNKPRHDWASHGADAMRTGAMYRYFEEEGDDWGQSAYPDDRSAVTGY